MRRNELLLNYKTIISSRESDWLILIHGLGGSSRIWYKQVDEYKKHFNVLLIDLYGHGNTKTNLSDLNNYNFSDIGKDIAMIMDKLLIERAHIVGISLGTVVANELSNVAPEKIMSMVLGGAVTTFNFQAKALMFLSGILNHVLPLNVLYRIFAHIILPRRNHKKSRDIFIREAKVLTRKEFIYWRKLLKSIDSIFNNTKENSFHIPRLYIMGNEDHVFIKSVIKDTVNNPYDTLEVINDCGHICNIEKHKEFNNISIQYLQYNSIYNKKLKKKVI